MKRPTFTRQEEAFCRLYALLQNPAQAARLAGYPARDALMQGLELLESRRIASKTQKASPAKAGLRRLAFGEVGDAVRLLLAGEEADGLNPDSLDLFNVSELRRVKGGGFEVRFFDRMEALDRLAALERQEAETREDSFSKALAEAATALGEAGANGEV